MIDGHAEAECRLAGMIAKVLDRQGRPIGALGKPVCGPVTPTRILGHDVQDDVAVDEDLEWLSHGSGP